jgi:hypothetical protein
MHKQYIHKLMRLVGTTGFSILFTGFAISVLQLNKPFESHKNQKEKSKGGKCKKDSTSLINKDVHLNVCDVDADTNRTSHHWNMLCSIILSNKAHFAISLVAFH